MKKGKNATLVIIILLLLVGVTSWYVASTYAKYTSDLGTKEGTATVAKWNFSTTATDFTINLSDTYNPDTLVANRIAPGTRGSFNIELSNAQSDVGAAYDIVIGTGTNVPANLKFYTAYTDETTNTPLNGNKISGTLSPNATTTVTIYWVWPYETGSGETLITNDANDTTAGTTGAQMTVPLTIKGTQVIPTKNNP